MNLQRIILVVTSLLASFPALAELTLKNVDINENVVVIGDTSLLDRSTMIELHANNESLVNLIEMITPHGWDVYIHRSESEMILPADFNGNWMDVLISLLEDNNLTGTVDIMTKRIDVSPRD